MCMCAQRPSFDCCGLCVVQFQANKRRIIAFRRRVNKWKRTKRPKFKTGTAFGFPNKLAFFVHQVNCKRPKTTKEKISWLLPALHSLPDNSVIFCSHFAWAGVCAMLMIKKSRTSHEWMWGSGQFYCICAISVRYRLFVHYWCQGFWFGTSVCVCNTE